VAREDTTVNRVGLFKKESRRVPKWYASAPNDSGLRDTCGCRAQGREESKDVVPVGTMGGISRAGLWRVSAS
jgi:hypothetical protein